MKGLEVTAGFENNAMAGFENIVLAECGVAVPESGVRKHPVHRGAITDGRMHGTVKLSGLTRRHGTAYAAAGKGLLAILLLAGLIAKIFCSSEVASLARTSAGMELNDPFLMTDSIDDSVPGYREYAAGFNEVYPEREIRIGAEACVGYEENDTAMEPVIYTDYEGMSGDSIYTGEKSLAEFEVNVEEEGFYNLSLEYYPIAGTGSDIWRSVLVDGRIPCREMAKVSYSRIWRPDTIAQAETMTGSARYCGEKDERGNDRHSGMVEAPEWITSYTYDTEGCITVPLSVYLTGGKHRISLCSLKEPMLIHQIILNNTGQPQDYGQVKAFWDAVGIKAAGGRPICIKAENMARSSSKMLHPVQGRTSPAVFNNIVSGDSWNQAGQWIEWEFDVEESGYYNISLYDCQNYVKGVDVFRKILLDGSVPFKEMESYGFEYGKNWREDVLSDNEGAPYVFFLKKGRHTIRMEVVLGGMSDIAGNVRDSVRQLNGIYREAAGITGTVSDTCKNGQLTAALPHLKEELIAVRGRLSTAISDMQELTGKPSGNVKVLKTMRRQLDDLIEDEERLVKEIRTYGVNVCACSNWADSAVSQPLSIERINIVSAKQRFGQVCATEP